jgi:UrcA family protein
VRTATVRFADLDTTSAEGAAALFSRIRTAARNVCVDLEADRSLEGKSAYQACVHLALGNALADIDLPALNTYASGHGFVARPVKMASVR